MSFQLGPHKIVINDPAQVPVSFYAKLATGNYNLVETDDDFQNSVAYDRLLTDPDTQDAEGAGHNPADVATSESVAKAGLMRIGGFGDFEASNAIEVIGAKAVPEQKQVSTVTFATGSSLAALVGLEVTVTIVFESLGLVGEFATHLSDYKRSKSVTLTIAAGETVTTLAAKLKAEIDYIEEAGFLKLVSATSSAGVATITGASGQLKYTIKFSGSALGTAALTAAFATTTASYEGRNTYEQLNSLRLQTSASVYPHALDQVALQIPIKGAKYSSYLITKQVSRPDLTGSAFANAGAGTGTFQFQLFINETTCAALITNITKWLNANVVKRTMYTSTTAAGVLGGDSTTVAVATDDVAPFTTPLV